MAGRKRILVAEDDPSIRKAYARLFQRLGDLEVAYAYDGQEALDMVRYGLEFDILLTDYSMPGLTGGELIRQLRQLGFEQPMVVISGNELKPEQVPGATEILGKPFSHDDLELILRRHGIL